MIVFDCLLLIKRIKELIILSSTGKIILLERTSSLSTLATPSTYKIQCFVNLNFNSTLQLVNGISGDLQILLWYFSSTTIVAFLKIQFTPSTSVFSNNSAL